MQKTNILTGLKRDLPAALAVFIIAVPLCLGIALASGAPLFSGLIAGIVGGVIVGFLSNSHTSVSGPAAGLTAMVVVAIPQLGSFEAFLLAVVLAGLFQIVLGFTWAGSIANYIPSSVIKGTLAAIGIIIILKQIPHALGFDLDAEGDEAFWQADGSNTFSSLWQSLTGNLHPGAIVVTLVSIGILLLWDRWGIRQRVGLLPGALVVVLISVLLNEMFKMLGEPWVLQGDHLVNIPVAKDLAGFLGLFTLPDFSQIWNPKIYTVALTIFAVATIETLLCIEAVDKLDPEKRTTDPNRELKAQGIGNIVSGLLGGLPITSVILRSSVNLNAGATSKMASILHGVLILGTVAIIPVVFNLTPLAAVAAVLLLTGYKLARIEIFKEMWANGKYQWWPFIITVLAIVFTNFLIGIGIGLAASAFAILRGNMRNAYYFHRKKYHEGDIIYIKLSQEVSFLNKGSLKMTLDDLPEGSKVVMDASDTAYIDFDVLEIIRDFLQVRAPAKNIQLTMRGFQEKYDYWTADFVYSEPAQTTPEQGNTPAKKPDVQSVHVH